jgi:hypothetical protein
MLDTQALDYGVDAITDRLVSEAGTLVCTALERFFRLGGEPMSEQETTDCIIYQLSQIGSKFKEEVDRRLGDMAEDGIVSSNRN